MELITIVEIDQPSCQHTYGIAPCLAVLGTTGNSKCYNTHATCQNRANYDASETLTLRFCSELERLPNTYQLLPYLQNASTRPVELNIIGGDPGTSPLGKRAQLTATLRDAPYHDRLTDPYWAERVSGAAQADGIGYDPMEFGTFWSKWQARNPIHANFPVRILRGAVTDGLNAMRTEHYILERIDGPASRGGVSLKAKDILRLADDDNVKYPIANTGVTSTAIADSAMPPFNVTLLPAGVGDDEYPSSGTVRISKELMTYTRVSDVLTITARAQRTTEAATHDAGSTVQNCIVYTNTPFIEALYDLLTVGAGIDPSYIDYPAWEAEFNQWASSYLLNGMVTEPTGVMKIVGEILRDCISYLWWEPSEQTIRFETLRPKDTAAQITDTYNILADSFSRQEKPDERITALIYCYGMINPVEKADSASNFRIARVFLPPSDRPPTDTDDRTRIIYSRFLSLANESEIVVSGTRIIDRFSRTPVRLVFSLDKSDGEDVQVSDIINLQHDLIHDFNGKPTTTLAQIIGLEQSADGSEFEVICMNYDFAGVYGFITEDDAPSYADATAAERWRDGHITQDDGFNFDGTNGDQIL